VLRKGGIMIRFCSFLILCGLSAVQAQPFTKANDAFQHGYYEQAIVQWQAALASPLNPRHRLEATLSLARAYRHIGAYGKALNLLNTALPLALETNDTIYHALLLNELSKVRQSQGENGRKDAIKSSEKAISLARKANNPQVLAEVLNHWGNLLTAEYDYEDALEAYREALTQIAPNPRVCSLSFFSPN
jgi:tetratricopeptide (TPR) repeat protein